MAFLLSNLKHRRKTTFVDGAAGGPSSPPPQVMADHCDSTFSAIVAESVTGSHVLKIEGYSKTKELLQNGSFALSIAARVGGHSWAVRYYPNGQRKENTDFISLFLVLDDDSCDANKDDDDVKAKFGFSLLDKDGAPVPSYNFLSSDVVRTFSSKGDRSTWGYGKFIKREDLERSTHLRDDCFSVRCEITVMKEIVRSETKGTAQVPPSDLHQHLGEFLKNLDGTIVNFEVGGKRFGAHRGVLAARSSVFKAGLYSSMKGKGEGPIKIDDMDAAVFKNLLHFIYTDTLPQTTAAAQDDDDLAMAQHLLVAADRYDLARLKLMCEDKLCRSMNSAMVATSLALAEQHDCRGLKEACFRFLSSPSNVKEMMASDGYVHLKSSCPSVIVELMARFLPLLQFKAAKEMVAALH